MEVIDSTKNADRNKQTKQDKETHDAEFGSTDT